CAVLPTPSLPFLWVWAQVRLEETGGGLRAAGDFVLLSCRGYGIRLEGTTVWWYRQAPGGRLEWVSHISFDSSVIIFVQSVENRANASRDNSRSVSSLLLSALQPQDSARYFCTEPPFPGAPRSSCARSSPRDISAPCPAAK
uniref:Uncharacterized protein n=1 Tax=Melopsittacus undulatus TaxID=13146 RepID=A0A8C6N9A0_MELUD